VGRFGMDIKHPGYSGLIDDFPIQSARELKAKASQGLAVRIETIISSVDHATTEPRLPFRRPWDRMIPVHSYTRVQG
jgi:hypothetical protein